MRVFMDSMVALMLAVILAVVFWHSRTESDEQTKHELARSEVRRFAQQIALQTALAQVQRNERGYPPTIEPDWFAGKIPVNPLVDVEHPWLEIAGADQKDLLHPIDRTATNPLFAKFWYNPWNGIVRARVPAGVSDQATLDLYNFVNDAELNGLFADGSSAH